MRAFFLLTSLVVVSLLSHGQTYKDSISKQFLRYCDLLTTKQFAASTAFVNPKLFTIIEKQQMITMMEKTMNNAEIDIQIGMPTITSIGDSIRIGKMTYAKIRYTGDLGLRFSDASGMGADSATTISALETQFGEGNVRYDAATRFYQVVTDKQVIANSSDLLHWTFAVIEERQKPVLEKILPKELALFE